MVTMNTFRNHATSFHAATEDQSSDGEGKDERQRQYEIFLRPSGDGKSEKWPPQKRTQLQNICRVCHVSLKVRYGNCGENTFFILSEILKNILKDNSDCLQQRFAVSLQCLFSFQLYATRHCTVYNIKFASFDILKTTQFLSQIAAFKSMILTSIICSLF